MRGGQEQHVPHQVVLELVVADEGCEGTQAELQGEDHFGGGLEPGGGRGHGGPVGAMRTVMLSGPLHSMHAWMVRVTSSTKAAVTARVVSLSRAWVSRAARSQVAMAVAASTSTGVSTSSPSSSRSAPP